MGNWLSNEPGWVFRRQGSVEIQHAEGSNLVCCFGNIIVEATVPSPSRRCGCRTLGGAERIKAYSYQPVLK